MINYNQALEVNKYYHIYNSAVGSDNLFKTDENYYFFLQKYKEYISPVADTFAYCLMPNHFHFAVRIKSEDAIINLRGFKNLGGLSLEEYLSKQFSNFFNSYTKSFNKQQSRRGGLFEHKFKRKQITTDNYFKHLIHYIHYNPVHHGFVKDIRDWQHSSYETFFSDKVTLLKRDEVFSWFNDKENLYNFHRKEIDEKLIIEFE